MDFGAPADGEIHPPIRFELPKPISDPSDIYEIQNIDGERFSPYAQRTYRELLRVESVVREAMPREHELPHEIKRWTADYGTANYQAAIFGGFENHAEGLLRSYWRKHGLGSQECGKEAKIHLAKFTELHKRWSKTADSLKERMIIGNSILKRQSIELGSQGGA